MGVEESRTYFYKHKEAIINAIKTRTYKLKLDGGVRKLGIPFVIDRLIQQAINQVLSHIY